MGTNSGWQRFNRDEGGDETVAPAGKVRVCAYHIDWDEHPFCFQDVDTVGEARILIDRLPAGCSFNVDYGAAYDERGKVSYTNRPW